MNIMNINGAGKGVVYPTALEVAYLSRVESDEGVVSLISTYGIKNEGKPEGVANDGNRYVFVKGEGVFPQDAKKFGITYSSTPGNGRQGGVLVDERAVLEAADAIRSRNKSTLDDRVA